jgi:hypothetical protein
VFTTGHSTEAISDADKSSGKDILFEGSIARASNDLGAVANDYMLMSEVLSSKKWIERLVNWNDIRIGNLTLITLNG